MNPYDVLKVAKDATEEQIQSAWRQLSKHLHPDRNPDPNAANLMAQVNQARDILLDPDRRARYDRGEQGTPHNDYEKAREVLMAEIRGQLHSGVLRHNHLSLVELVRNSLSAKARNLDQQIGNLQEQGRMLAKRRSRLKGPEGNVFDLLLEVEEASTAQALSQAEQTKSAVARAITLCDGVEDPAEMATVVAGGTFVTGTSGIFIGRM